MNLNALMLLFAGALLIFVVLSGKAGQLWWALLHPDKPYPAWSGGGQNGGGGGGGGSAGIR